MDENYTYITEKACKFLLDEHISSFPIDMFKIIRKHHWGLINFTEFASILNISYLELKKLFGENCMGIVKFDGFNYTVAYDENMPCGAIRFTLAHEVGHIILGHLERDDNSFITIRNGQVTNGNTKKYIEKENQASCFARNIVSPSAIVDEFTYEIDKSDLTRMFGITESAAKARMDFLKIDISNCTNTNKQLLIRNCIDFLLSKTDYICLGEISRNLIEEETEREQFENELIQYYYATR